MALLAEPLTLAESPALAEALALKVASGKSACYIFKKSSENLAARFSLDLAVL